MMLRKRLDVQIDAERYNYIKDTSEKTGQTMNTIVDEQLTIDTAVKCGEVIEKESLPVTRDIINTERRTGYLYRQIHRYPDGPIKARYACSLFRRDQQCAHQ
jgi:hypothetical protein